MTYSPIGKLALALLMIAGPASQASAQDTTTRLDPNNVPSRIGNIWGGYAHEPQPAVVGREEQEAGVALSPDATRLLDRELELRAQALLHSAAQE